MPGVLVTGIPRSGSRHLSEVLIRSGVDAHHERVFSMNGVFLNSWTGVEVSWLAAPYLDRPWLEGTEVFHLTRHPEASFRSLMSNNFVYFERIDDITPWRQYVSAHAPEVRWPDDWQDRVLTFMEVWSTMLRGLQRIKIDEPRAVAQALGLDLLRFEAATAEVGTDTNHWTAIAPIDLRPDLRDRLHALVTAWDYEPWVD